MTPTYQSDCGRVVLYCADCLDVLPMLGNGVGWKYFRHHEMVMVAHRRGGKLRWPSRSERQANIIRIPKPPSEHHPNEKPLRLIRRFIQLHSSEGDTILDPFIGSGTTGVAAILEGRKFIGIEIDENYFEIAKRRIVEALAMPKQEVMW